MTEMLWVLPPGEKGQATALNLGIDWQPRNNRHTRLSKKGRTWGDSNSRPLPPKNRLIGFSVFT